MRIARIAASLAFISASASIFPSSGLFALRAQTAVTLTSGRVPLSGQAGTTSIVITGTGFPAGTILPANTIVKLEPATGGTAVSINPVAVTTVPDRGAPPPNRRTAGPSNPPPIATGATREVSFLIPASVAISSSTAYLVSISGTVSGGGAFASSNKVALTINPPAGNSVSGNPAPSISIVTPNSGQAGQNLSVTITGLYTNFVQGTTQASFGPGISVGGVGEGSLGPVTVTSATTATAQISINAAAFAGFRTVAVATGAEQAALPQGFNITPAQVSSPVTISSLTLSPSSIPARAATSVTATAAVAGSPDADSVLLQRLDSSNLVVAVLGTFHDDGLNGDVRANDGIYTLQTSFTESAAGSIPLRVSATFPGALNHVFSPLATLTVTAVTGASPPATISFSAPANLSYLNLSPTTVSGTVSDPTATLVINSIPVAVAPNGGFSASIPLAEGPNIVAATATSAGGAAGTGSITVTLDTTPPHVAITSPPDQFITSDASISVAGNVNDIVVGTVNDQQATVKINGVAAQVANRTFLAPTIPLSPGPNTIQAVATDRAGNSATTQITVTRQAPSPGQISVLSGNNQTGTIGAALTAPLVVTLTDTTGAPAVNKPVIFGVTQNNGLLAAAGALTGTPAASIVVNTDARGQAQSQWTLGQRAGAGGNAVQAYAVGFSGTALFTATGNQGPPGIIVVDSGNNQTGAINQALPKPFIAVVVDSGSNRLAGVPVTFTVKSGSGSIGGQPSVTVNSDSDGRVAATLTLGFQEGTSNNIVTADFPNDTGFPAAFTASGLAQGDPAKTIISGVVLDNSDQPIPGVTVRAVLTNVVNSNSSSVQAAATVATDAKGQFSIYRAPVGLVKLLVDGSTATVPGPFPTLDYDLVTVAGQVTTVGKSIYLLPIKTSNQLCVTASTGGGTLTIPEAPGFSLTFAPNQVTFPGGSRSGCISVTPVHPDKVPMVPGFGQQPRFIVTIQPSGALFDPPAPITLPNVDGFAPRAVTEMYSYDHDISSFVAIGTGTVSDDGQVIRSNTGVGVLKAGWHCGGNPQSSGAAAQCGPCAFCDGVNCQPNSVQGNACQNPCLTNGSGTCTGGHCTGTVTVGAPCGNGGTCDANGNCGIPCTGPNCSCTGPNCGCGNCNSGNPCIDDSCGANSQCVATPNQFCQNACAGKPAGATCSVGNLTGTCDASGNCNLCSSLGAGSSCTCGSGGVGTCDSSGQCSGGTCGCSISGATLSINLSTPSDDGRTAFAALSFISTDPLSLKAQTTPPCAAAQVQWSFLASTPASNGSLTPPSLTGALYNIRPIPPPAPLGRQFPLSYSVEADLGSNMTTTTIVQDAIDSIRQQYVDMGNSRTPRRAEFINSGVSPSGGFTFDDVKDPNAAWAIFKIFSQLDQWERNYGQSLTVNDGYRTPETNLLSTEPAGAPESQHQYGTAADVRVPGSDASTWAKIRSAAKDAGACVEPFRIQNNYNHVHAQWTGPACPAADW